MPNRLPDETSPYLLQHADNPVDWWPWGADALAEAKRREQPILLSIGYAACHWCHVMAHESFEDAATAALMNSLFVNVKVDREERPDLDGIYMQAVQAMTGQGGWPMTVFLTPEGAPFYGGTYFPPEERHGMPSFRRVVESVSEAWTARRGDVLKAAASVGQVYAAAGAPATAEGRLDETSLATATKDIAMRFEPLAGGFGGAPKFPLAMTLDFLLRRWARTGDERSLHIVEHSFVQMGRGGLFDQIGGGFHRYTVDARWLVPHFEKMLYDNALLARLGVHLWQARGDAEVRRVTDETLQWVLREMTDPSGGFYASLDADSEGHEGKFYVWSLDEFREVAAADADWAVVHFGITSSGNFEGKNIPTAPGSVVRPGSVADPAVSHEMIARAASALYDHRAARVRPGRDEKILASWNGLMLRAMAEAARVFDDETYRAAAVRNGHFLWSMMVRDGRAYRSHTNGETRIPGFLEDHAAVALGFLSLYQLTFDRAWLERAETLAESCTSHFWDEAIGAFFDTANDHETLVTRPRDISDNATPAGTSLAVELLLTLAEFTGDTAMRTRAEHVLDTLVEPMTRYGTMFGCVLSAADLSVHGAVAVAIAGDPSSERFAALARAVAGQYLPALVLAGGEGDAVHGVALMEGRTASDGLPMAFVCRDFSCDVPTSDPGELAAQLAAAAGGAR
jgi:uncharacterized protein YyaL (SSP411 family)